MTDRRAWLGGFRGLLDVPLTAPGTAVRQSIAAYSTGIEVAARNGDPTKKKIEVFLRRLEARVR
jgi:hypothetical protein